MVDVKISQLPAGSQSIGGDIPMVQSLSTVKFTLPAIDQAASVSTLVQRNASGNAFFNNYLASGTVTVSAGGTTVLTAASSRFQALTGSSAQTYQLPDATTLSLGPWFIFNNNSSQALTITNAGGSTLYTVPAGGIVEGGPTNIGTANGTWDFHPIIPSTVTWGSGVTGLVMNTALSTTPAISAGASSATSPSFIPQRGTANTGYGGDATTLYGIIGGATAMSLTATGITVGGVPIYSGIPQNSQSTAYTTVLADAQKHILHPTADNNARTFTIAANASVAYPVGTAITFVNQINTVTIAINSDTLVLAGAGTTGSRTLAASGIATALKIATTTWMISGTGLT